MRVDPSLVRIAFFSIVASLAWGIDWVDGQLVETPRVIGFERFERHRIAGSSTNENLSTDGGDLLIAELNCVACHAATHERWFPKGAPSLAGLGNRLHRAWLREYLRQPHRAKVGGTMPSLLEELDETSRESDLNGLVDFLTSQSFHFPEFKASGANPVPHEFWNKGRHEEGQRLFHRVGCIACHEPEAGLIASSNPSGRKQLLESLDEDQLTELGLGDSIRPYPSIPFPKIEEKYDFRSLTHFLLNPESTHRSGRMPNMKLSVTEGADIAAYLMRQTAERIEASVLIPVSLEEKKSIEIGKKAWTRLGCQRCHRTENTDPLPMFKPMSELELSAKINCIDAPKGKLPKYRLDALQAQAIRWALSRQHASEKSSEAKSIVASPSSKLEYHLKQYNCLGCHERDKRGGIGLDREGYFSTAGNIDLGDEGRLPPLLDHVGWKLSEAMLKKVLQGLGDQRPYLQIRMPKYVSHPVDTFPSLFFQSDIPEPSKRGNEKLVVESELVEAGRTLFDRGCVQCHPLRGESLPSVLGIDLGNTGMRVQQEWFRAFLRDPVRWKARTRMPSFFAQGGTSQDVLEGDVEKQIHAIWTYLNSPKAPLPEKLESARSQNFELVPSQRPIVLRTFMENAGTHAIAVGFREKVHFAFNSKELYIAELWKGRFIDAQGSWFDRFTPPVRPLGHDVRSIHRSSELAWLNDRNDSWPTQDAQGERRFLGYRLDLHGVPTLEYQLGSIRISDQMTPNALGGFDRTMRFDDSEVTAKRTGSLWLKVIEGNELQEMSDHKIKNEEGLQVQVHASMPGIKRSSNSDREEWLLPLSLESDRTIRLEYTW